MGYPYQGITPDDYQRMALRTERTPPFVKGTSDKTLSDHGFARLMHGMIGVCTEAGELQDMVKKALIYNKPFDRVNVLEEIGDCLWYCALALDAAGYTMAECMEKNIDKLRVRFPDKFTFKGANNRDLDAERASLEKK
jgi:NTP pyrophosphatase (non-canonical NTP hydrolase)